jgi:hypothetical protein
MSFTSLTKTILVMAIALTSFGSQAQQRCVQDSNFKMVCAPFGGTILKNSSFQLICAPGQCVVVNGQEVKCSSQAGGAAQVNSSFQAICSGGCVSPSASYCAGDLKP